MAPKSHVNGSNAHEARIQRLEDGLSELKASHSEMTANLHNLGVQVDALGTRISDKIDAIVKPLHDTLHDHIKEDTLSRSKLDVLAVNVDKLEEASKARAARWGAWKKAIIAIVTGAGAIGLKELIVFLARH